MPAGDPTSDVPTATSSPSRWEGRFRYKECLVAFRPWQQPLSGQVDLFCNDRPVHFPRERFFDYHTASGDASDSLPGIPGVGALTASKPPAGQWNNPRTLQADARDSAAASSRAASYTDDRQLPSCHSRGRLAQLVRASALHAEGRGFEPLIAHHSRTEGARPGLPAVGPRLSP
jgi:hypothetical protein